MPSDYSGIHSLSSDDILICLLLYPGPMVDLNPSTIFM